MNLNKLFIILFALTFVFFVGCDEEDDINEFEVMTDYMVDNSLDLPDVVAGWIVDAQTVFDTGTENYFIVDVRTGDSKPANGTTDFEDGHIPGAHMVPFADVVDYVDANYTGTNTILVVCYSGQSAGFANVALRLSGYSNVQNLKFGMSSWHSDFDVWTGNTGNAKLDNPTGWSTDAPATLPTNGFPTLDTGEEDGDAILAARVDDLLTNGFLGVAGSEILTNYANYNVINYWAVGDWDTYGHITDAYQVTPGTLGIEAGLGAINPDEVNVPYCWTGQTSAMVTAWLTVLGYEVKSLKFGVNSMIYDDLAGHKWSASMDFAYDTGS